MNIGVNILYIIPDKIGGTETYARNIIPALSKKLRRGDKLILFAGYETAPTFPTTHNIEIITLPVRSANRLARILAEQFLLPLYCVYYKVNIMYSLGYSAPFLHHCPSVVTIHDVNWYYHPEDFSPVNRLIWEYLTRLSAITSDHIVTDSKYSANSIVNILRVPLQKVTPILHGVPAPIKLSKKEATENLAKLKIKKPFILTVVAGYPHKNLSTLLKVFAIIAPKYKSLLLVVCGLGGKADISNLKLMKNLGLHARVKILGYVDRKVLASLYLNTEVFIFPSAYEGFGYPPIESMSYGAPVVSANSSSLPEVVGNGGYLVDTYAVEQYVKSIETILTNKHLRNELVRQGKERIRKLNWEKSASDILLILNQLKIQTNL